MNKKVYVEQDKWNVLRCLDMRVRERELITRNMNEAGIHVVPMRQVHTFALVCFLVGTQCLARLTALLTKTVAVYYECVCARLSLEASMSR